MGDAGMLEYTPRPPPTLPTHAPSHSHATPPSPRFVGPSAPRRPRQVGDPAAGNPGARRPPTGGPQSPVPGRRQDVGKGGATKAGFWTEFWSVGPTRIFWYPFGKGPVVGVLNQDNSGFLGFRCRGFYTGRLGSTPTPHSKGFNPNGSEELIIGHETTRSNNWSSGNPGGN